MKVSGCHGPTTIVGSQVPTIMDGSRIAAHSRESRFLKVSKLISMNDAHQDLRSMILTIYLYTRPPSLYSSKAGTMLFCKHLGPPSSSDDGDIL
jgi:hypothetical protein